MLKEHGHAEAVRILTHVLVQAQIACGEPDNQNTAEIWAASLLSRFNHFSLETFVLSIRDGLTSGKVYGRLNLPQLAAWMGDTEQRIVGISENEAMSQKEAPQNLGGDYMDRLQYEAERDKRKLQRANAVIDELRRKLSNDDEKRA